MTDPRYVLDASADLARFFDEPGGSKVADWLDGALLSAVDCHETVAKLVDRGLRAAEITDIMAQLDVALVPVVSSARAPARRDDTTSMSPSRSREDVRRCAAANRPRIFQFLLCSVHARKVRRRISAAGRLNAHG